MTRYIIALMFFVSGAAGLIYEVVWVRMFTTVFGNTVYSASTVLTAFMFGLALGSFLMGRISSRIAWPLKTYALLQVGVAIFALLIPIAVSLSHISYSFTYSALSSNFYVLSLVRFIVSCLILIPPATLMGGTLPILSRAVVRRESAVGGEVGNLYSLNTLGAVLGCFLAGFILIASFGLRGAMYFAVGMNVVVALWAFRISKHFPTDVSASSKGIEDAEIPADSTHSRSDEPGVKTNIVLLAYAISGFAAMGCELVWTRLLVYIFGTTTYAFSIMLTTFLLGIGIGSAISSRFVDRIKRPIRTFALLEVLLGIAVLGSVLLLADFVVINRKIIDILNIGSWQGRVMLTFIEAGLIMLPSTLIMGAIFPIAGRIGVKSVRLVGRGIGNIYSANTFGGILGSVAAGFVLLPALGAARSMLFVICLFLAVALLLYTFMTRDKVRRIILSTVFAVFVISNILLVPPSLFNNLLNANEEGSELIFWDEGVSGTVTIHDYPTERLIAVDGCNVAGTLFELRTTQKLQGHIPLLIHPDPRDVLQIGFGSGETSKVVLLHGVESFDCVEICQGVINAAPYFADINSNVVDDARLGLKITDGKNYVRLVRKKYDVILNDSTYPTLSGSSALYTRDHFQTCWEKLNSGGVFSSWVPLDLREIDLKTIFRTFSEVFPDSSLWLAPNSENKHALILGVKGNLEIDLEGFKESMSEEGILRDLQDTGLHDPFSLLSSFLLDPKGIKVFSSGGMVNTDNSPYLEFYAPRRYTLATDKMMWSRNLEDISAQRVSVAKYLTNCSSEDEEKISRYFESTSHLIRGIIAQLRGDALEPARQYRLALSANPDDKSAQLLLNEVVSRSEALKGIKDSDVSPALRHFELGMSYWGEGKYEEASEEFEKTLKIDPDHVEAHTNLGNSYKKLGRTAEAITEYKTALKLNPSRVPAMYNLATLYLELDQTNEAEDILRKVAEGKTEYTPFAYNLLGNIRLKRGDANGAMEGYKRAIEAGPGYAKPHFNLALLYDKSGKMEEAAHEYETTVKLDPGSVQAYNNLGYVYERLGQNEKAEDAYDSAIKVAPQEWGTYYNLGGLYMRLGKPDLALETFQKGAEITGNEKLKEAVNKVRARSRK